MKITIHEDEIKDAIIRHIADTFGKISVTRDEIWLYDAGVTSTRINAEITLKSE